MGHCRTGVNMLILYASRRRWRIGPPIRHPSQEHAITKPPARLVTIVAALLSIAIAALTLVTCARAQAT